jgi:hypothetical protein
MAFVLFNSEYYFSVDNLVKDMWMRSHMNARGYIPITILVHFNRLRSLAAQPRLILLAARSSPLLKVKKWAIRARKDWYHWTFPPHVSSSFVVAFTHTNDSLTSSLIVVRVDRSNHMIDSLSMYVSYHSVNLLVYPNHRKKKVKVKNQPRVHYHLQHHHLY